MGKKLLSDSYGTKTMNKTASSLMSHMVYYSFKLKSLIHFEFILVYGVRTWSSFIFFVHIPV